MVLKPLKVNCNENGIRIAVSEINNGCVAVFPTDTVYGIGCNPYNKAAVDKIYKIKKRERSYLFPILGYSKGELSKIVDFDENSENLARKFWPGPLTIIQKLKDEKLAESLGVKGKIAIRIPNNPCTLEILKEAKLLVGTSANLSGKEPSRDPDECIKNCQGYDIFVDGGILPFSKESTIVEFDNDKIIICREGAIPREEIMKIF